MLDENEVREMKGTKQPKNKKAFVLAAAVTFIILIVGIAVYKTSADRLQRQIKPTEDLTDMEETDSQPELASETEERSQDPIVEEGVEEDAAATMYQEYYDKLIELQSKYGVCEDITEDTDDPFLEENRYLKGLCFAKLIDFDADGTEEMILAYNTGEASEENFFQDYIVEVWAWRGQAVQKVYSDMPMNRGEGALGIYLILYEGKYYLYNYIEKFNDETYASHYIDEWGGYDGGVFDIFKRSVWEVLYSEDAKTETFRIDDRDVTKEEWADDRESWTDLADEFGFQNGAGTLDASVSELAATFKALSERLGIEWIDNISEEKEEKPYSNSVWGTELIGYWETLFPESSAVWTTLTFYGDGMAELHTRSGVCFGTFEIQPDGSVMLYLHDEYLYSNAEAQWFHEENNMQIQLTEGGNMYEMNFAYIGGTGEASIPDSVVLNRVTDVSADYSSAEEAIRYYEGGVSK